MMNIRVVVKVLIVLVGGMLGVLVGMNQKQKHHKYVVVNNRKNKEEER